MSRIYVDGDACPVKDEILRVAGRYAMQVFIVSNQCLRSNMGPYVQGILVGREFDAADNWIVENIAADDIVITADIQLAARCLKKNAKAVGPTGKFFTEENIGSVLAMRELSSYLREAGEIKGGNAAFSKKDRSNFLQSLDLIVQRIVKK